VVKPRSPHPDSPVVATLADASGSQGCPSHLLQAEPSTCPGRTRNGWLLGTTVLYPMWAPAPRSGFRGLPPAPSAEPPTFSLLSSGP
jgi:hypothetical protein